MQVWWSCVWARWKRVNDANVRRGQESVKRGRCEARLGESVTRGEASPRGPCRTEFLSSRRFAAPVEGGREV